MSTGELIPPPIQAPPAAPRAVWAWWVLIAVMVTMVSMSVYGYVASLRTPAETDYTSLRLQVRMATVMRDSPFVDSLPESQRGQLGGNLAALADQLTDDAKKNSEAAALMLALRRLQGQPWGPSETAAVALIEKDGKNLQRTILAALQGDDEAANSLPANPRTIEELIARQYGRAENPDPAKPFRLQIPADVAGRSIAQLGLMMTLVMGGFAALVAALVVTLTMRPRGFPVRLSLPDTDRFALRMSIYFGLFMGISLAVGIGIALAAQFTQREPSSFMIFALLSMGVLGLIVIPMALKVPLFGIADPVRVIVGEKGPLWSHLLWGVGTYFLNWPLIILLGLLMTRLLPDLPPPSHEALTQLAQARDPFTLLALFFVAAVYAPIVEELMFRGVLFPAVSEATKKVWVGVLVSSVVFAMIHQQGPVAWPSLALIGATAAWVTYRTGSLIPAIIMHALHNGTTLLMGYLASR
jgi:membrane protease YdiL (CAAX protease family)